MLNSKADPIRPKVGLPAAISVVALSQFFDDKACTTWGNRLRLRGSSLDDADNGMT